MDGLMSEDQSGWPEHLRDDAPHQHCDRCGRKTWSAEEFDSECRMPQQWSAEAGWHAPCGGRFRSAP